MKDFAEYKSKMFLVLVDAYSKWFEVIVMKSTTAKHTIHELRKIFSAYGAPKELVSDNGPQFTAENFQNFLKMNSVKHALTALYQSASKGNISLV